MNETHGPKTNARGGADDSRHLSRERLERFLDGDLPEAERKQAEAHLARCATCRREAQAYRLLFASLQTLPEPEPPADFDVRVLDAVLPAREAPAAAAVETSAGGAGIAPATVTPAAVTATPVVSRAGGEDAFLLRMTAWVYALVAAVAAVGVSIALVVNGPAGLQNAFGFVLSRMVRGGVEGLGTVIFGLLGLLKAAGDMIPAAEAIKTLGRSLETAGGAVLVPQVILVGAAISLLALTVLVWASSSARERGVPHVSLSL